MPGRDLIFLSIYLHNGFFHSFLIIFKQGRRTWPCYCIYTYSKLLCSLWTDDATIKINKKVILENDCLIFFWGSCIVISSISVQFILQAGGFGFLKSSLSVLMFLIWLKLFAWPIGWSLLLSNIMTMRWKEGWKETKINNWMVHGK